MKLRTRNSEILLSALFFLSLTALAFGIFTVSIPGIKDRLADGFFGSSLADTIIKGKSGPTATPDTALANSLQRADAYLKANKLEASLAELERALKLRPTDKTLNTRVVQLKAMIADNSKKKVDFQNAIVSGDASFMGKDYLNAKAYYQVALNLFPSDSTAKEKLRKTMDLIRSKKAQNTLFDVAVANADRLFQAGEYDRARDEYENASRILPSEQYPKQKINEIIKIQVDSQLQDGLYVEAIKNADQYYNAKNWQPALQEYQNALKIRPKEKYPKDRIAELTTLVAAQRNKDEAYIKLIADADQQFSGKTYLAARKNYESASKLKPDQSYPKNRIAEIDRLLSLNAKTQKTFDGYIALGDSFYIDKNFLRARDYYTLALGVKPGESYPKEMLEKLKPMVAGQEAGEKAKDESYLSAIAVADKEFTGKNWDQARKEYQRASGIKPAEAYPKERIAAIDKMLLDQQQASLQSEAAKKKALDAEYAALLASGEKLFKAKTWESAKGEYQKALALKPEEALPKRRISSIDSIADVLMKQKSVDDQYTGIIGNADKLLAAKTFDQAKAEYQKASALKPTESYPKDKIKEIDNQLAEIARLKKLDSDYTRAIAKGDSLLGLKQYALAKSPFTEAAALKPAETYPKEKLAAINTALADLAKQQELDKQYDAAVKAADKLLAAKSYTEAKTQYTAALALKPSETYPATQIAGIDKTLDGIAKQKALDAEYAALLASGEKLFKAKTWEGAKGEFQKALALKPDESLPKKRISSIDSIADVLMKQKSVDDQYTGIIGNADKLLAAKTYDQAKAEYQKASALKPSESYPKDKIKEIESHLAEIARLKKLDSDYSRAIAKGDSLLGLKQYALAKSPFTEAAALKPAETYPKEKLAAINTALADLAKQQELDKQYDAAVKAADKLLAAKSYTEAKTQYTAALALKPSETYPATQIAGIDKTLEGIAKQKALDAEYAALLASGEKLFKAKTWESAKGEYQKALALKPEEALPKRRISSIDSIADVLMKQKSVDDQYTGIIGNADKLLAAKTFDQAKAEYQKASALKPSESYPKDKIKEIESHLAEIARLKKLDSDYTRAIEKGDSLLGLKQYALAKSPYTDASALKPVETYPKEKLSAINTALADLAKQQELDKQYDAAVKAADKLLAAKSYTEAKTQYTAALALKPSETYPATQIAGIDKTLEGIAKQKALDAEYAALLASGEKLFKAKTWESAKGEYQKALALKPEEALPKRRISSIDSIADVLMKQKSVDDQYTGIIGNADKLLAAKTYDQAKAEYQKASALKPTESYPKDKIKEIDNQLAEIARLKKLDSDYTRAIAKGDSLLGLKQYALAKSPFTEAAALKPVETYPKEKLADINTALADLAKQQELDLKYQGVVSAADKLFAGKVYNDAKSKYSEALTIKSGETYPKSKISEIDKIITDSIQKIKALDAKYAGIISNADNLLLSKTYEQAKKEYNKALEIKPSEEYPKTKIIEIEKALADLSARKERDSAYAVVIGNADKLLAEKSYESSKSEYQKALQIKADEIYPKTKISEIDKLVADVARQKNLVENNYKASVGKADRLFQSKSYEQSKSEYKAALVIKPAEQYPQDRIKEIDNILAELKVKDDSYKVSITKADQLLLEKKFEEARTEYENSLTIKPGEQYPKNKVEEINQKLVEIQGKKKTFDDLVLKGDNSFGIKDYGKSREFFQQATSLFPEEKYPKERLDRVNGVIDSIYRANKSKYDKAIAEADKFYNGFEFDKAIDSYNDAAAFLPMENYPRDMIARIQKTISENAIADVLNSPVTITSNNEKQFKFTPVNIAARKDNFIYIKLRNLSSKPFNVLLRYGKDKTPSGGVVIRNLSPDGKVNERLISVREQDVWYRIDNDFISLYPQGGDIEVSFIQVSKAR